MMWKTRNDYFVNYNIMNYTESEKMILCYELVIRINKKFMCYSLDDNQFELIKSPYSTQYLDQGVMIINQNKVYLFVGSCWKSLCLCDL